MIKLYHCPVCGGEISSISIHSDGKLYSCDSCRKSFNEDDVNIIECYSPEDQSSPVNHPNHYGGGIECIDYLRDKLTKEEFTGFCMGNVLKYTSRWRKKDGLQDLKKARVYLEWAIESEEHNAKA